MALINPPNQNEMKKSKEELCNEIKKYLGTNQTYSSELCGLLNACERYISASQEPDEIALRKWAIEQAQGLPERAEIIMKFIKPTKPE